MTLTAPRRLLAALIAVLLAAPACGGVATPSQNQTSEFEGVLQPGSLSESHEFGASKNGEFTIRITRLGPPDGLVVEVILAQFIGNVCTAVIGDNPFAVVDQIALTGAINRGRYCVAIADSSGLLTEAANYTINVSHP